MNVTKYIGIKIGTGIIIGARDLGDRVAFNVLDDHEVIEHIIPKTEKES